jgi:hypothetical protein
MYKRVRKLESIKNIKIGVIKMKQFKSTKSLIILMAISVFTIYLAGCSDSNNVSPGNQTDDQYLQQIVSAGTGSNNQQPEDLMSNEANDLDNSGAVPDNENGGGDTPIDTLKKWGRRITNVNVNLQISNEGDTIKDVNVTRTITGNYYIVGIVSGQQDTIVKPYVEVLKRTVSFKRIARTTQVSFNWKLYKISILNGGTVQPQNSDQYIEMQQAQVYVNGNLKYTFTGPDFTQNIFTTERFGGAGIPEVNIGDHVTIVISTYSAQSEQDIVAWHWARNTFGFHRVPFVMTSQTPNGAGWNRTYEKTFTIYPQHRIGVFNGYISASTHKSLYDNSPVEFSSDEIGVPYKVQ